MKIIESVKWPKPITPDMRSFLEGLLTKDSTQRLTWPELLQHPFVLTGVKCKLSMICFFLGHSKRFVQSNSASFNWIHCWSIDTSTDWGTTYPQTATDQSEGCFQRSIETSFEIHARRTSKGKMSSLDLIWIKVEFPFKDVPKSPGNKDKTPKKTKIPTPHKPEVQPPPPAPVVKEPVVYQSALAADSLATQEDKFVSARENLNPSVSTTPTIEEQEIEQYAEQIESMSVEQLMHLINQPSFFQLFETIQTNILTKLLECTMNGASFYRNMMKIVRFLLQSDLDPHLIISFTHTFHIPDRPLKHLKAILDHPTIRKEVSSSRRRNNHQTYLFFFLSLGSLIFFMIF